MSAAVIRIKEKIIDINENALRQPATSISTVRVMCTI